MEGSAADPSVPGISRRDALRFTGGLGLAALTVSTPTTAASAAPGPAAGVLLCRDAWGARPARAGGRPHTIDRITIHHSAVALPDNRGITERLRQHQRYHQDDKGWVDIAYHAAVDRRGNIFALRSTAIAGDTATDYDTTGHFLVLCEGNFDEEAVTAAQLNGAALVCAWATKQFGITTDSLATHREVTPVTSCPGADLEAHVASGDLKQRIDGLLAAGFSLTPACAEPADRIVAGIEAGR